MGVDPERSGSKCRLHDAATLKIRSQIATGDLSLGRVRFVEDSKVLVIGESGPGIILETDPEKLIELAKGRVVGDFTTEQCERYWIERCMPDQEEESDD